MIGTRPLGHTLWNPWLSLEITYTTGSIYVRMTSHLLEEGEDSEEGDVSEEGGNSE